MRTFAQQPKESQQWTSASCSRPGIARFEATLRLQRAIGNQALLRLLGKSAHEEVAQRQIAGRPAAANPGSASPTERLNAIIGEIERILAIGQGHEREKELTAFLDRLREVAGSDNEELKLSVLAGFSSQGVQNAEKRLAEEDVVIEEQRAQGVAAKSLGVSRPCDAAEVEAERVASAVIDGSQVRVIKSTAGFQVNRQADALAAAGAAILGLEAELLPVTSWNPPGWVVLGVGVLVAAALIGTAVLMAAPGNVADTGILDEAQRLISAAAGSLTMCEALAQLMAAAERARDTRKIQRIKSTQKAKGCRHSRHS
jgi:hypothetical protein